MAGAMRLAATSTRLLSITSSHVFLVFFVSLCIMGISILRHNIPARADSITAIITRSVWRSMVTALPVMPHRLMNRST